MFLRRTRMIKKFGADRGGSPALEFALIAPLFFAAVFGTFELGRGLYERSRFEAAAAIATRTLSLDPDATESAIKDAIYAKLDAYDPDDLNITITDKPIDGQPFKQIDISHEFKFLVSFSHHYDSVTLTTTRYAPMGTTASSGDDGGGEVVTGM